jgi:hypothetical protein
VKLLNIQDILNCPGKHQLLFSGENLEDALSCGFSYVEAEDHVVFYVIGNGRTVKRIICQVPDSEIDPWDEFIGSLWTSKLAVCNRLKDTQILFANETGSVVLMLNINNIK